MSEPTPRKGDVGGFACVDVHWRLSILVEVGGLCVHESFRPRGVQVCGILKLRVLPLNVPSFVNDQQGVGSSSCSRSFQTLEGFAWPRLQCKYMVKTKEYMREDEST